jgi:peroxiredoxin
MADLPEPHHLNPGSIAPVHSFRTIRGAEVDVKAQALPTHIQFRLFAGCPVCNLHLRSLVQRKTEIGAAVREVVLFHSSVEELLIHAADLPFDVVADPDKTIYRAFGVQSDRIALERRAWPTIAGHNPVPPLEPAGGRHGLPADFLVTPDGRIEACKYGNHADDQWTVDDVLALVAWISPRSARA